MTDYERWMDAFDHAWHQPQETSTLPCPCCSAKAVTLVYIIHSVDDRTGMSAFWCNECLHGAPPNTGHLPEDFIGTLSGEEKVPNYSVITPD